MSGMLRCQRKHSPEDKAITRELMLLAEKDKSIYQKHK